MKKIFTFTGAQSTGKSTLLKALQEKYSDKFDFVPEVTRRIARNNIPINDTESNYNITQQLIIADHLQNFRSAFAEDNKTGLFLDRCIVDGYIYTLYLYKNNKVSYPVLKNAEYWYRELFYQYDEIFYTDPKDVELIDDGIRSNSDDFRNDIIKLYEKYILHGQHRLTVLSGTVEQRLAKIEECISKKLESV